ncbi:MAG TPA: serine hydrolase domain-containing protein, partial [Roseiflexaceae bacterium]|nr:serine hydrolase domain-containing protein [Roseiflexaceae bacterium]
SAVVAAVPPRQGVEEPATCAGELREPLCLGAPAPDQGQAPAAPAEGAPRPIDPALAAELQRILDATVADGYIPGAVAAVSIPGYEPWVGASGRASRRDGTPMAPNTHVRIASISKMFTMVVVLQLAEEGVIDLDAPMSTWLPGLVPAADAITVRDLLRHTTGLYDYLEDIDFMRRAYRAPDRHWRPEEIVAYAARFPARFRPGGRWDYSSTNYVILGMIVQKATGNTLAHEVRQRVIEPLGLQNTYITPDEAVQGQMARGYARSNDHTNASMSVVFATANIVSTVADMQRFAQGLFGGELLKPATMEQVLTFVDGRGQYNMPALEYGLGVMRNRLPVGPGPGGAPRPAELRTVLGHIGGYGGFRAALWHAPASGITITLGVNQASSDPNILATRLFHAVLSHQGK